MTYEIMEQSFLLDSTVVWKSIYNDNYIHYLTGSAVLKLKFTRFNYIIMAYYLQILAFLLNLSYVPNITQEEPYLCFVNI